MKEAVNCYLFLNADDSCLIYQHSDISKIEQNLGCALDENLSGERFKWLWKLLTKLTVDFGFCTKKIDFCTTSFWL